MNIDKVQHPEMDARIYLIKVYLKNELNLILFIELIKNVALLLFNVKLLCPTMVCRIDLEIEGCKTLSTYV